MKTELINNSVADRLVFDFENNSELKPYLEYIMHTPDFGYFDPEKKIDGLDLGDNPDSEPKPKSDPFRYGKDDFIFALHGQTEILGVLLLSEDSLWQDELVLAQLEVRSDVVRKGIGSKLVKKAVEECNRKSYSKLTVVPKNKSLEFYKKLGFKLDKMQKNIQNDLGSYLKLSYKCGPNFLE